DVRRDDRVFGDAENALVAVALRLLAEDGVDLVDAGRALGDEGDVGDRADGDRRADRNAVELALELRQRLGGRDRGAGRGRHEVGGARAAAAHVPGRLVDDG